MAEKLPLGDRIRQRTADAMDLPADVIAGVPRITMIGCSEVQISNHTGLLEYGVETLRFGSRRGDIVVEGKQLRLQAMNRFEVLIGGEITAVRFGHEDYGDE